MKNLQLVIEFTNPTASIMTTKDVLNIDRALRSSVGVSYEVSTLSGNRFTVMLTATVPDDFNVNVLENRLNLALGDSYYQLFVVGDLGFFPVTYQVTPSHKYPLENVEQDVQTVLLKIAAAHASSRHDNHSRMLQWQEERGCSISEREYAVRMEKLEQRCTTDPWLRVSPAMRAEWKHDQRTLSINLK